MYEKNMIAVLLLAGKISRIENSDFILKDAKITDRTSLFYDNRKFKMMSLALISREAHSHRNHNKCSGCV